MFALTVTKVNDRTTFKDGNKMMRQVYNPKKGSKNMSIHVETIKSKQVLVKRGLERVLAKVLKERYGVDLRLMP